MQRTFNKSPRKPFFRNGSLGLNRIWTPSLITTSLWIDSNDPSTITQTGSGVSNWSDKSGNSISLTQSDDTYRPTIVTSGSLNYIEFASNRYLNIPQSAVNNATAYSIIYMFYPISSTNIIFVKQHDGNNTYNLLSTTVNGSAGGGIQTGTTGFTYWRAYNAGTQSNSNDAFSTSTNTMMGLVYNGSNVVIYEDGNLRSTTTTSTSAIQNVTNATNFTMGAWIASGSFLSSGNTNFRLGEMIYVNSALSTVNRQLVEGYLAHKWGTTSALPASHPYKSIVPRNQ